MRKRKIIIIVFIFISVIVAQLSPKEVYSACDDSKRFAHPDEERIVCSVAAGDPLYSPSDVICVATGEECGILD